MTAAKRYLGRPLVLGITGMMCAGKSTVSKLLVEANIPVYDADSRVKALYDTPEVRNAIESTFIPMKKYFYKGGLFDKQAAISYIFTEDENFESTEEYDTKNRLEAILSPFIVDDFENFIKAHNQANVIGFESAILFTSRVLCDKMDYIFWVEAKRETLLKRAFERNGFSEKNYDARMRPVASVLKHAYYMKMKYNASLKIRNEDGTTLSDLRDQIFNHLDHRIRVLQP